MATHDTVPVAELVRSLMRGRNGAALPRRAVLPDPDGGVAERADHADLPEARVLSHICDLARAASGQRVLPRDTRTLMAVCLRDNDPDAWRAWFQDRRTRDVEWAAVRETFAEAGACETLIKCVVASTTPVHLLCILYLVGDLVHAAEPELLVAAQSILDNVTRAICPFVKQVTETTRRLLRSAPRAEIEFVLRGLGKLFALARVPPSALAPCLRSALEIGADMEVLHVFTQAPLTPLRECIPDLTTRVLDCADKCPPQRRYVPLAIVARLVHDDPECMREHGPRVLRCLTEHMRAIGDAADCKTGHVAGYLAHKLGGPMEVELGVLLLQLSAAQFETNRQHHHQARKRARG